MQNFIDFNESKCIVSTSTKSVKSTNEIILPLPSKDVNNDFIEDNGRRFCRTIFCLPHEWVQYQHVYDKKGIIIPRGQKRSELSALGLCCSLIASTNWSEDKMTEVISDLFQDKFTSISGCCYLKYYYLRCVPGFKILHRPNVDINFKWDGAAIKSMNHHTTMYIITDSKHSFLNAQSLEITLSTTEQKDFRRINNTSLDFSITEDGSLPICDYIKPELTISYNQNFVESHKKKFERDVICLPHELVCYQTAHGKPCIIIPRGRHRTELTKMGLHAVLIAFSIWNENEMNSAISNLFKNKFTAINGCDNFKFYYLACMPGLKMLHRPPMDLDFKWDGAAVKSFSKKMIYIIPDSAHKLLNYNNAKNPSFLEDNSASPILSNVQSYNDFRSMPLNKNGHLLSTIDDYPSLSAEVIAKNSAINKLNLNYDQIDDITIDLTDNTSDDFVISNQSFEVTTSNNSETFERTVVCIPYELAHFPSGLDDDAVSVPCSRQRLHLNSLGLSAPLKACTNWSEEKMTQVISDFFYDKFTAIPSCNHLKFFYMSSIPGIKMLQRPDVDYDFKWNGNAVQCLSKSTIYIITYPAHVLKVGIHTESNSSINTNFQNSSCTNQASHVVVKEESLNSSFPSYCISDSSLPHNHSLEELMSFSKQNITVTSSVNTSTSPFSDLSRENRNLIDQQQIVKRPFIAAKSGSYFRATKRMKDSYENSS